MKVLIATTHLNKGGISSYILGIVRNAPKFGAEISVLSSGGDIEPEIRSAGAKHFKADIRTKNEFSPRIMKASFCLSKIVMAEGFDIIHAQTRVTQVMADIIKKFTGRPYVSTCHGYFRSKRVSRRILPCWGDRTIAISRAVKEHLVRDMKVPDGKIDVVYNGIDVDVYSGIRKNARQEVLKEIGLPRDARVVGSVGRFSTVKGFDHLVGSFSDIASSVENAFLVIVGQGREEKDLKRRARSTSMPERIFFISGKRPLPEYLDVIDVFCMPSLSEGFGLAVVEAMASGKPCVVSGVGGMKEIVTHGKDGLIVPPADPRALSEAVKKIMLDDVLSSVLSENARKRACDFSADKNAENTVKVYHKVSGASSGHYDAEKKEKQ